MHEKSIACLRIGNIMIIWIIAATGAIVITAPPPDSDDDKDEQRNEPTSHRKFDCGDYGASDSRECSYITNTECNYMYVTTCCAVKISSYSKADYYDNRTASVSICWVPNEVYCTKY